MNKPPLNMRVIEEILEQPEALKRCVENYPGNNPGISNAIELIEGSEFDRILIAGMGGSEICGYPLWLKLSSQLTIPVILGDVSELIYFTPKVLTEKSLLIAVSQSGESAETIQIHRKMAKPRLSISVTNGLDNTLAKSMHIALDICAGEETAASSKTYVTSLAVLNMLGCQLTGSDLRDLRQRYLVASAQLTDYLQGWEEQIKTLENLLEVCDKLAFIGRGPSLAGAREGALINMETSKVLSMALSGGQFRHGPIEIAKAGFTAVIFAGEPGTRPLSEHLALEIGSYGGRVLYITPDGREGEISKGVYALSIPDTDPDILPIFEIIPVQLLTIALASNHGVEAGRFTHGSKVTTVE